MYSELKRKSGIYKIINTVNNKIYIGSTKNLRERFVVHWRNLRNNNHDNSKLQNAWNKYGGNNFQFVVLETINDETELLNREQYYLNSLLFAEEYINGKNNKFKELGYNLSPTAANTLGFKHSKETKLKLSKSKKGISLVNSGSFKKGHKPSNRIKELWSQQRKGIDNSFYGKKHTEETKNRMRKLNELQIRIIRKLLDFGTLTQKEIGSIFHVSDSTVCDINLRRSWADK